MNTLGVNLSDPSFDSGPESAEYMVTLNSAKDAVEDGAGNELSSSVRGLSGVTMADMWRLTSSFSVSGFEDITANISQVNNSYFSNIGSAMSESSGIFTFPETGIYKLSSTIRVRSLSNNSDIDSLIYVTENGTDFNVSTRTTGHIAAVESSNTYITVPATSIIDVSDISNIKVKFQASASNTASVEGNSSQNYTYFTFKRLGDR